MSAMQSRQTDLSTPELIHFLGQLRKNGPIKDTTWLPSTATRVYKKLHDLHHSVRKSRAPLCSAARGPSNFNLSLQFDVAGFQLVPVHDTKVRPMEKLDFFIAACLGQLKEPYILLPLMDWPERIRKLSHKQMRDSIEHSVLTKAQFSSKPPSVLVGLPEFLMCVAEALSMPIFVFTQESKHRIFLPTDPKLPPVFFASKSISQLPEMEAQWDLLSVLPKQPKEMRIYDTNVFIGVFEGKKSESSLCARPDTIYATPSFTETELRDLLARKADKARFALDLVNSLFRKGVLRRLPEDRTTPFDSKTGHKDNVMTSTYFLAHFCGWKGTFFTEDRLLNVGLVDTAPGNPLGQRDLVKAEISKENMAPNPVRAPQKRKGEELSSSRASKKSRL